MNKTVISFLIISFLYAPVAFANPDYITEKEEGSQSLKPTEIGNGEEDDKKSTSKSSDIDSELEDSQELETDSSYYSVNKFNILLYFVYKLKYGEEDEQPVEE